MAGGRSQAARDDGASTARTVGAVSCATTAVHCSFGTTVATPSGAHTQSPGQWHPGIWWLPRSPSSAAWCAACACCAPASSPPPIAPCPACDICGAAAPAAAPRMGRCVHDTPDNPCRVASITNAATRDRITRRRAWSSAMGRTSSKASARQSRAKRTIGVGKILQHPGSDRSVAVTPQVAIVGTPPGQRSIPCGGVMERGVNESGVRRPATSCRSAAANRRGADGW